LQQQRVLFDVLEKKEEKGRGDADHPAIFAERPKGKKAALRKQDTS